MMDLVREANLTARFLLELCALVSLGYWGFVSGGGLFTKIALGIGSPLLAAVVWGLFVSPKAAVPLSMPLRLAPEILVFGVAVAALYWTGHRTLALVFLLVAVVNRAFVFVLD